MSTGYFLSGKDKTEQGEINKETLDEISLIIKALTVICLNVENSPLGNIFKVYDAFCCPSFFVSLRGV